MLGACLLFACQTLFAIDAGMPNPPASPTIVKLGVFLADIIDLNELDETFEVEIILIAEWHDPRLAFDAEAEGMNRKLFQGEFQFNEVFSGWWPQFLIVNEVGRGDTNAIHITIHPDGTVQYKEQRNVTLETPMDLEDFPFDVQSLEAYIIPFGEFSDSVQLVVDERVLGATEEYAKTRQKVNIAQWTLTNLDLVADKLDHRYYGDKKEFSEIKMTITMQRKSANMIWKVIIPLLVLVLLMWAIFWIDVDNLADRLNTAFIGILTIVAYQFLIDGTMPRIDYFTFMDAVLLYSFIFMCLTIIESLVVYSLHKANHVERALQVDFYVQWFFPIAYLAGFLVCYFYYYLT